MTSSSIVGFREEGGVKYAGQHIIADFWGMRMPDNEKFIEDVLVEAAERAGATVLSTHFHKFGPEQGVTGVVILAESHISIHTWPEEDFAAVDIFMCGKADPKYALEIMKDIFKVQRVVVGSHKRGVI